VSASILAANLKGHGPDAQRSAARRLADGTTDAGQLAKLLGSPSSTADAGFAAAAGGCRGVTGGGGALGSGNVAADMIQVTIKCDKRVVVFDGVSKDVRCSALLSMLEVRLGVKIPGNARLIGNGRFVKLGDSIAEVIQILPQYLTKPVLKPLHCFSRL